jgi:Family of unknown function (DUF5989)
MAENEPQKRTPDADFAAEVERGNASLAREIWDLIAHNKKWWLVPVVIVLLAIGLLVLIGSSAVAPFIYPLF